MNMVTVDDQKRIQIPDAKPGQVFDFQKSGKDSFTLTLVNPVPPGPVKSELVVKNGYTFIRTGVPIDYDALQAALKEFP
jgi:hypothetical protein